MGDIVKRGGPTRSGKDHTHLYPEIISAVTYDDFLHTIGINPHWSSNRRRINFVVSPRLAFDCFLDEGLYILRSESSRVESGLGGDRNWRPIWKMTRGCVAGSSRWFTGSLVRVLLRGLPRIVRKRVDVSWVFTERSLRVQHLVRRLGEHHGIYRPHCHTYHSRRQSSILVADSHDGQTWQNIELTGP